MFYLAGSQVTEDLGGVGVNQGRTSLKLDHELLVNQKICPEITQPGAIIIFDGNRHLLLHANA